MVGKAGAEMQWAYDKQLGVLTYNVRHRKTYDTLCLLKARGYRKVNVYGIPMHYKKSFEPLLEHRPPLNVVIPNPEKLCYNLGYCYKEGQVRDFNIPRDEILLVCGAGLLPTEFVAAHTIINAHPGYLPNCRGLDALKWAIMEEEPIGVTTHLLGEYADAGEIIERREIEIKGQDTFHALAWRVYENEVGMLVDAVEKLEEKHMCVLPGGYVLHKRMPNEMEHYLIEKFVKRKEIEGRKFQGKNNGV